LMGEKLIISLLVGIAICTYKCTKFKNMHL
jgi:hypothetical protein